VKKLNTEIDFIIYYMYYIYKEREICFSSKHTVGTQMVHAR
jgi:hypothetical protein